MGEAPRGRDITIEFECQFRVDLQHSDFSSIMKAFLMLLPQLLEDFFQKVLVGFGEYEIYEMGLEKKSFICKCCGNDTEFQILNVAGPRASKDSAIYRVTMDLLETIFPTVVKP